MQLNTVDFEGKVKGKIRKLEKKKVGLLGQIKEVEADVSDLRQTLQALETVKREAGLIEKEDPGEEESEEDVEHHSESDPGLTSEEDLGIWADSETPVQMSSEEPGHEEPEKPELTEGKDTRRVESSPILETAIPQFLKQYM